MKRILATNRFQNLITSFTTVSGSDNMFTDAEIQLIEGQCDAAYDEYSNDSTVSELAEIVWEHVEWLQNELEDEELSGNLNRQSVISYAEDYIDANY